jgi:outer membrane protein TolC
MRWPYARFAAGVLVAWGPSIPHHAAEPAARPVPQPVADVMWSKAAPTPSTLAAVPAAVAPQIIPPAIPAAAPTHITPVAFPAAVPTLPPPDPAPPESPQDGVPLTLATVMRLALLSNLDVAQARAVVAQAGAALMRAQLGWLPNLNLGTTYTHHEGNIQKTEGNIIKVNRDSLWLGGGPTLTLSSADAVFGPLIARRLAAAGAAGARRVDNEALQAVADAYLTTLRARRRLARVEEVLENLTGERAAPLRAGSKGLLPLVRDYVEVGRKETLKSDLARVEVEVMRRREEQRSALQEFLTARAELARLLHLDARSPLWPDDDFRFPIAMPTEAWTARPVADLLAIALRNRPELAENAALVAAATDRVRQASLRPLLPTVNMGYNWGDFGGGPDLNPPIVTRSGGTTRVTAQPGFGPSGRINHFSPRTDFEAALNWRLQGFGLGNRAEVREQQALERQAVLRRSLAEDRVAAQVVQTHEAVRGWRERLDVTRAALFDENGRPAGPVFRSVQLNFDRIRSGDGRPLEVLDSIRSLSDTLELYGQAVTEYERSQIRLLVALGLPAQVILDAVAGPRP